MRPYVSTHNGNVHRLKKVFAKAPTLTEGVVLLPSQVYLLNTYNSCEESDRLFSPNQIRICSGDW